MAGNWVASWVDCSVACLDASKAALMVDQKAAYWAVHLVAYLADKKGDWMVAMMADQSAVQLVAAMVELSADSLDDY